MHFEKTSSRRRFLKGSLTAAAAIGFPTIVPARVFGRSAPSNMIQVAQIGCGRIARDSEFKGILRNSDVARYVAVCDLDTVRIADAKNLLEQAYAKKFGAGKYAELKTYGDYREMLQDKSIDAVCISTPDHWHAQPAMEAALAGKDIYLQKPASLTIKEGRQMADTMKRTGRIFQQGSQQRSAYQFSLCLRVGSQRPHRQGSTGLDWVAGGSRRGCGTGNARAVELELRHVAWLDAHGLLHGKTRAPAGSGPDRFATTARAGCVASSSAPA